MHWMDRFGKDGGYAEGLSFQICPQAGRMGTKF
jgi:hypothetical protein